MILKLQVSTFFDSISRCVIVPDWSSPFRVTQYCFHLRRVTSSSFLSLCRVTSGLKESQPARLTTPCSFSNNRSSCSREPSADSLLLSPSSVPVDGSLLSPAPCPPCPVPVSSSLMKFSYIFWRTASLVVWWMAPDDWAREAPGNQRRPETWEGELVSAVRPSTPLSKASLKSRYLVSWKGTKRDTIERLVKGWTWG